MKGIPHFLLFLFPFLLLACSTSGPGLFGKQSPHEQYAQKLSDAGLKETALGGQWFGAAEQALTSPVTITLPYKEIGYFAAETPRAVGLQFSGRQGEKLVFRISKNGARTSRLYADLWEANPSGAPSFIKSVDTAQQTWELEIEDNTTGYILRLQPELLSSMDYELSISISPSLAFPVAGQNARIASVWGDARDAGARQHEGIDIFASKRTPALAAADGRITAVNENNLGGLVVWLRPQGKAYNLYYAHLDEQLATAGQQVSKGDTIGLIGNTGNARTTPPHLHFGIYTFGGAVDPLPFVNPTIKNPAAVNTSINLKEDKLRLLKSTRLQTENFAGTLPAQTLAKPLAVTATSYRVMLPDKRIAEMDKEGMQKVEKPLRQATITQPSFLLESPFTNSPRKQPIDSNAKVGVLGIFDQFLFVRFQNAEGWVNAAAIK